ncbi:MAG: hypothetical protein ACRDBO_07080 [Lachnospiraceae bacterium]
MDIPSKIAALYDKDTSLAYQNLKELEELSGIDNSLYPYMEKFLSMVSDEKYVIRVRGYRLLCKQARWDSENIIDANITLILQMLDDEKPTAIRQKLKALEDVARYKANLHNEIQDAALMIDLSKLKDTMQPLIYKDIQSLLAVMENKQFY